MGEFDDIASEWEEYRSQPNPTLKFFLHEVADADVVLEAGCANGRNLLPLAAKARSVIGFDTSAAMLKYARERIAGLDNATVFKASAAAIPLPAEHFDKAFCLAVLHHLSTPASRAKAFGELYRVLKPGGMLYVTVWNRHQKKFGKLKQQDSRVNWRTKSGKTVKRFYHFFDEDELRGLGEGAGFAVRKLFYDKHKGKHGMTMQAKDAQNLCAVLQKPAPAVQKPVAAAKARKRTNKNLLRPQGKSGWRKSPCGKKPRLRKERN